MSNYLSKDLLNRLQDIDNRHCAYCHTKEANTGQPMTVDHIIPKSQGGETVFENLCFACRLCNEFKSGQRMARDPLTGESVRLFIHVRIFGMNTLCGVNRVSCLSLLLRLVERQ